MILVSIGANLHGLDGVSPLEACRRAVAALDLLPNMRVKGLSRWYETAPVPPSGQPPYVNAVVHLVVDRGGSVDPALLLARLMEIEQAAGRARGAANAARTLDLDIIAMGALVRAAPDPILPHPRAHQRAFVLVPLRDVAPGWVHPVFGLSVDALLADLPPPPPGTPPAVRAIA
ncbi:MAG: 2-amino-4-hydroxy-6-hydroxymethyldihydropteridine diphosphokinase [Acetobacteraceae bacterium]|nr:2-amino-4-hydroxy-6-hydroxymethyldihydropteridine diphosphokinase [Acetobacteraceae bacterium]